MAAWNHYAELELDVAGVSINTAYATSTDVFLCGITQSSSAPSDASKDVRCVYFCNAADVNPLSSNSLKSLDENAIKALISRANASVVMAIGIDQSKVVEEFIRARNDRFGFNYSLRHAMVSQYESNLDKAHEIARKPDATNVLLRVKNPLNRIIYCQEDVNMAATPAGP